MGVERKYPFYVISVDKLLALERWVPHQISGAGAPSLSDEEDARVAFVSHQWTGSVTPTRRRAAALPAPSSRLLANSASATT